MSTCKLIPPMKPEPRRLNRDAWVTNARTPGMPCIIPNSLPTIRRMDSRSEYSFFAIMPMMGFCARATAKNRSSSSTRASRASRTRTILSISSRFRPGGVRMKANMRLRLPLGR